MASRRGPWGRAGGFATRTASPPRGYRSIGGPADRGRRCRTGRGGWKGEGEFRPNASRWSPFERIRLVYATVDRLQVPPFRHMGQERVVRGGPGDFEDLNLTTGLERGPFQHHQEISLGNQTGT